MDSRATSKSKFLAADCADYAMGRKAYHLLARFSRVQRPIRVVRAIRGYFCDFDVTL